ncbi:hypothetical protein TRVL_09850 [Trypanosoma vivax]|nr:hypothetical protein TRVL_09850 [Trypanosoma vivax]
MLDSSGRRRCLTSSRVDVSRAADVRDGILITDETSLLCRWHCSSGTPLVCLVFPKEVAIFVRNFVDVVLNDRRSILYGSGFIFLALYSVVAVAEQQTFLSLIATTHCG